MMERSGSSQMAMGTAQYFISRWQLHQAKRLRHEKETNLHWTSFDIVEKTSTRK